MYKYFIEFLKNIFVAYMEQKKKFLGSKPRHTNSATDGIVCDRLDFYLHIIRKTLLPL
jgi:hypothetical protein